MKLHNIISYDEHHIIFEHEFQKSLRYLRCPNGYPACTAQNSNVVRFHEGSHLWIIPQRTSSPKNDMDSVWFLYLTKL